MARREVIVFVYLPGEAVAVPAGLFMHDGSLRTGTFQYGELYLQRPNAVPVDPINLPLHARPAPTQLLEGLYGAFRDAAPDAWGRLVVERDLRRSASQLSEIDYLLQGGSARTGNLDFRLAPTDPEKPSAVPTATDLSELVQASNDLVAEKPVAQRLLDLLVQGTTMGGARPKSAIVVDGELWLAKFPLAKDRYNNPLVEFATLNLAESCGLRVAERRIVWIDAGRAVLLLRRFDREPGLGGLARIGFISGLTLLRIDESDRAAWSYPALAEAMRSRINDTADLRELYRRMAFNVAVRNTDDHPRNHGFLVRGNGLDLSPAYDLVPAAAAPGVSTDFDLAMAIGAHGRHATIENLLSEAPRFGLEPEAARAILRDVGRRAANWRDAFLASGVALADLDHFTGSFVMAEAMRDIL